MPASSFDGQPEFSVRILPCDGKFVIKSTRFGFVTSTGLFAQNESLAGKFDSEDEAKTFAENYDLTVIENSG